jgi:AcrR family transcriptional regulator
MTITPNNRSKSNSNSTKKTIEESAISILSEKGYAATSMREIAEASGVSKPVIYYYFKSKENLCQYIIQSGLESLQQQLREVCEEVSDDVFEQLIRTVELNFEFCRSRVMFVRFMYALNFGPDRKKINYDFQSYSIENSRLLTGLITRASDAGLIRSDKVEATVDYLRGIITTYVMRYVDGRGELPSELPRTIVTDIISGLGADGTVAR